MSDADSKLPFLEHLEELRKRLIRCAFAILLGFIVAYIFKEPLFEILVRPLVAALDASGNTMIFTGLPEAFFTYLKVSLLAGLVLALPVVFYEFWMFVAPGLYHRERTVVIPIVLCSLFFFAAGSLFAYYVVFPLGFKFFLSFASETIRPLPSMKEYLSFASKMLLAFGLAFELPLVLTGLAWFGLVDAAFLKKNRKYAVLVFFTVAAVLTPPDVISQVLLAIPLLGLYELSIWGAKVFGRKDVLADEADDKGRKKKGKPPKEKKTRRKKEKKKDKRKPSKEAPV